MDLLNWRKEKGLSRLKFSKLSGIPISTIVKHEDGKKTRKETLCKRPVDYRSYIGRFGLFYDSNEDCSYFGMLTSIQNGFQRNNGFCYKNFRLLTDEEKERL